MELLTSPAVALPESDMEGSAVGMMMRRGVKPEYGSLYGASLRSPRMPRSSNSSVTRCIAAMLRDDCPAELRRSRRVYRGQVTRLQGEIRMGENAAAWS